MKMVASSVELLRFSWIAVIGIIVVVLILWLCLRSALEINQLAKLRHVTKTFVMRVLWKPVMTIALGVLVLLIVASTLYGGFSAVRVTNEEVWADYLWPLNGTYAGRKDEVSFYLHQGKRGGYWLELHSGDSKERSIVFDRWELERIERTIASMGLRLRKAEK